MRGRHRSWLAGPTLLVAVVAAGCTGGRVGPVAFSGVPRPTPPPANIADVLAQDEEERFDTLLELVLAEDAPDASDAEKEANAAVREANAEVVDALTGTGPVSLFAPTDAAFAKLGLTVSQLKADPEALAETLSLHVATRDVSFSVPPYVTDGLIDGRIPPEQAGLVIVSDVSLVPTVAEIDLVVNGALMNVSVRDDLQAADVIEADIQAPNGFIQVIDQVLIPPPPAP